MYEWVYVVILLVAAYAAVAWYVHYRNPSPGRFSFYGPILAVKTSKVGFLDRFTVISTFLRVYSTIGVAMVVLISATMVVLLFFSLQMTLVVQPEPTGIYAPQNLLLIPGINEYVPATFAVWFALVLAIAVHEFGHGVLARVEKIRVKAMGALILVIPIGFFVEPDEEEMEKARGISRVRVFGAGITNNVVVGAICFVLMILLVGAAVPTTEPVIQGVYQNYSAYLAGVPAPSVITAINGTPVETREQVSAILNTTHPGQDLTLSVDYEGQPATYNLTLSEWPEGTEGRTSGFLGIYYYQPDLVIQTVSDSLNPLGMLRFLIVPFDTSMTGQQLSILAFDTPDTQFYEVPVPGFWVLVHILFWSGWININLGIFNALPMIPLDGGYILKEGVDRTLEKRGLSRYAPSVTSAISALILVLLASLIMLPYLLHA
ncbi:membrane-associated protease RseP (regulator of RpoE activity) [Methanolinea mesophila]|uniref:site-2 protease family protein n=1 Tax=Methanolinea mesophila TaxID=547055 RepID=UPI001AE1630D|nr:site-2 protease family protein [Methanolinea mesophila]MBP1928257.1 membrane-associated protease RseP (regulator of RpoE activity) [Methanolinea mesophila]